MTVESKEPEQAYQVVGHDDEAEGGFRGPKVLQAKRLQPEVLLELRDPIFIARSAVILRSFKALSISWV